MENLGCNCANQGLEEKNAQAGEDEVDSHQIVQNCRKNEDENSEDKRHPSIEVGDNHILGE